MVKLHTAAAALTALLLLAVAAPAGAATPFKTIQSDGPLTGIAIGNEGSCQIAYRGDSQLELFPPDSAPGDCGTFLTVGDALHGPDFPEHPRSAANAIGTSTPFSPVSQTEVTGGGTAASPFRVVTVYEAAGTGLRVTQTDSYVVGQEAFRTDVQVQNTGGAPQSGVVYRAGDCFLQEDDTGFGFVENGNAPGCAANANNSPAGRIEQWYPLTAGSSHLEAQYEALWAAIGTHKPFNNSCVCAEDVDNAAGLSWSYAVQPGQSATFSHLTVFSPSGVTGGRQGTNPPVFGSGGVVSGLPATRRCVSRRSFRIRLREVRGLRYTRITVTVNGRRVATRRGRRITAPVNLRGLPRGRYTVRITVRTSDGRTLRGTRRYRTCAPRRTR